MALVTGGRLGWCQNCACSKWFLAIQTADDFHANRPPPPFQHFPLVKLSYTCKAPKESWAEGRRGSRDSGQEELNMHGYVLELDCQVGELAACHGS